ncbi:MAG TPA: TadE/TadG family type IV pilus assembly protein [Vicinamibacterales bacterium]|nr:TadE/TadG family type IV pilus assembly protein [Vicinamibacterales bacterium]
MKQTDTERQKNDRGAAMIEMALTLPLLLLLSVSVFEFGRAFQTWQVLTNATREGARVASLPGTTDAAVSTRVQEYLAAGQLPSASFSSILITRDVVISIGGTDTSASTVTVNYPFEFMVLQPIAGLVVPGTDVGEPITMSVSATMRNE